MSTATAEKPAVQPGAYKLADAAVYLGGLNIETVRRYVKRKLLTPSRASRHLIFSKVELDRFLADTSK